MVAHKPPHRKLRKADLEYFHEPDLQPGLIIEVGDRSDFGFLQDQIIEDQRRLDGIIKYLNSSDDEFYSKSGSDVFEAIKKILENK